MLGQIMGYLDLVHVYGRKSERDYGFGVESYPCFCIMRFVVGSPEATWSRHETNAVSRPTPFNMKRTRGLEAERRRRSTLYLVLRNHGLLSFTLIVCADDNLQARVNQSRTGPQRYRSFTRDVGQRLTGLGRSR